MTSRGRLHRHEGLPESRRYLRHRVLRLPRRLDMLGGHQILHRGDGARHRADQLAQVALRHSRKRIAQLAAALLYVRRDVGSVSLLSLCRRPALLARRL
jgi:hypothetical protein